MSTLPQQRRPPPKPTVLRGLATSPVPQRNTVRAPPQSSNVSPASCVGNVTAATAAPPSSTALPSSLPSRPVSSKQYEGHSYIPPRDVAHRAPESSSQRRSHGNDLPAQDRSVSQTRKTTPPPATRPSQPTVRPWWGGNPQRSAYASRSWRHDGGEYKTDTSTAGDLYHLNYTITPEHESRSSLLRRPASTAAQEPSECNAPNTTDELIAHLLKPHPKLLAQALIRKINQEKSAPRPSTADSYRPTSRPRSEPQRLNSRQAYSTWSKERLLREANLHRLDYEHEEPNYLVEIMLVNDRKFFDKLDEYKSLNIKELLEEAEVETVFIAQNKHWEHRTLLAEVAEKVAQVAVARHNDSRRAEQIARQSASRIRTNAYMDRPSKSRHAPKKLRDLAHKKSKEAEPAAKRVVEIVAQKSGSHPEQSKQRFEQKKVEPRPSTKQKVTTSNHECHHDTDSGYSTGQSTKKRSRPAEDKDEYEERRSKKVKGHPADILSARIGKVLRARRSSTASSGHDEQTETKFEGSKTQLPQKSSNRSERESTKTRNANQVGRKESVTAGTSLSQASVAVTVPGLSRKRKIHSSDGDDNPEDIPFKPTRQSKKRKTTELISNSDDSNDSELTSGTEDDLPWNNSRAKHGLRCRILSRSAR
jgi:hypothetical protein